MVLINFYKCRAYLNRFQAPEWWTIQYGYLCCVALLPFFAGATFSCLRDIIILPVYVEGPFYSTHEEYSMAPKKVAEWMDLETCLIKIAFLLGWKFLVGPALSPVLPSLLGFRQTFRTHHYALFCFTTSHDWFMMWMAFLSFTITQIEYTALKHNIPDWYSYLLMRAFPKYGWMAYGSSRPE